MNESEPPTPLLIAVRYVLPATVVLAGMIVMALGSETDLEGGGGIVSAGLAIYFLNWLFRLGRDGESQRDDEDAARDYFDEHGRWPGEPRRDVPGPARTSSRGGGPRSDR